MRMNDSKTLLDEKQFPQGKHKKMCEKKYGKVNSELGIGRVIKTLF